MVSVSVIQTILAPPLGTLAPHLDENGPYGAGDHRLTQFRRSGVLHSVTDTYGVYVTFGGVVPPGLGQTFGYNDAFVSANSYHFRIAQICVLHQFLGGAWVISQSEDMHSLPNFTRWSEALPGAIGLYVLPNCAVDLYYLTVL